MSIKAIHLGHPWITLDQYSKQFSKETSFIVGTNQKGADLALLLNDPNHPQIKARVWTTKIPFENEIETFQHEFNTRLLQAFQRRNLAQLLKERENIYLAFGEADFLPGLFILLLGEHILIQNYCSFWNKKKKLILSCILIALKQIHPNVTVKSIHMQNRDINTKIKFSTLHGSSPSPNIMIKEFDTMYSVKLGQKYDIGLYTDMSSIRKKILPLIKRNTSVLNLFSYTGSFSLMALKRKASEVLSVDISNPHNKWLEHNIAINDLSGTNHQIVEDSVEQVITNMIADQRLFDIIICDPPSFSQAEEKNSQALSNYGLLLPKLFKILSQGGKLLIFLNTHKIKRTKFKKTIQDIIYKNKLNMNLKIIQELQMDEDCFFHASFPEGDYLKGFIIEKS